MSCTEKEPNGWQAIIYANDGHDWQEYFVNNGIW